MKKFLKKATAVAVTVMMMVTTTSPVFASEFTKESTHLSTEAASFLKEHDVDLSIFERKRAVTLDKQTTIANSYDESVLALKDAAEAYNFTDEQIQKYVEGLVTTPTTVVGGATGAVSTRAENRDWDNGLGYEVKAVSGYYQETAFATLPSVYRAASSGSHSDGYMFYTVSGGNWGIDVGLAYNSGNGVEAWRGCYTPQGEATTSTIKPISGLQAGSQVYFNGVVETNGYLRFRVLDANNFSTVYYDISYYVGDHGIYRSNATFNRQISLCNASKNFNTGAYLRNAQFSNAYIYSSSGYSRTTSSNTLSNRRGRFGTNATNAQQVTVNSYTPWYAENVSVNF